MSATLASRYRRPWLDPGDALLVRCFAGSALAAVAFVALVRLVPAPPPVPLTHVDQLPQRFARLILEPAPARPAPVPPPAPVTERVRASERAPGGGGGGGTEAAPLERPAPAPGAPAGNRRVESMHALPSGGGTAGVARARAEVSSQLTGAKASLQSALAGLDASLGVTSTATGGRVSRAGRSRAVRGAAGAGDLDAAAGALAAALPTAGTGPSDLGGTTVTNARVAIGELSTGDGGGTGGGGAGSGGGVGPGSGGGVGSGVGAGSGAGSGAAPGVHRSNASLLAVIQRYAPGIQYCYGNELKREPTLKGKLVVAITVAASGEVTDATVVQNTTGSQRLAACALSQVRDWRFPAVAGGSTTFQAPFVFTPPS